jgi:hypothetical protein
MTAETAERLRHELPESGKSGIARQVSKIFAVSFCIDNPGL